MGIRMYTHMQSLYRAKGPQPLGDVHLSARSTTPHEVCEADRPSSYLPQGQRILSLGESGGGQKRRNRLTCTSACVFQVHVLAKEIKHLETVVRPPMLTSTCTYIGAGLHHPHVRCHTLQQSAKQCNTVRTMTKRHNKRRDTKNHVSKKRTRQMPFCTLHFVTIQCTLHDDTVRTVHPNTLQRSTLACKCPPPRPRAPRTTTNPTTQRMHEKWRHAPQTLSRTHNTQTRFLKTRGPFLVVKRFDEAHLQVPHAPTQTDTCNMTTPNAERTSPTFEGE